MFHTGENSWRPRRWQYCVVLGVLILPVSKNFAIDVVDIFAIFVDFTAVIHTRQCICWAGSPVWMLKFKSLGRSHHLRCIIQRHQSISWQRIFISFLVIIIIILVFQLSAAHWINSRSACSTRDGSSLVSYRKFDSVFNCRRLGIIFYIVPVFERAWFILNRFFPLVAISPQI